MAVNSLPSDKPIAGTLREWKYMLPIYIWNALEKIVFPDCCLFSNTSKSFSKIVSLEFGGRISGVTGYVLPTAPVSDPTHVDSQVRRTDRKSNIELILIIIEPWIDDW